MKTKGNWVIQTSGGGFWCGNAHFDPQLRKAQIYHWKEAAEEQIEVIKKRKYFGSLDVSLEVVEVVPPQIRKDTEAEWVFHYDEECGIVHISYTCSCCGYSALNDYRGNSVASRFCHRCGKYMTNHTQEDDE